MFDKELLDFLAEQCGLEKESLRLLDETSVSWFDESVLNLVQPRLFRNVGNRLDRQSLPAEKFGQAQPGPGIVFDYQ